MFFLENISISFCLYTSVVCIIYRIIKKEQLTLVLVCNLRYKWALVYFSGPWENITTLWQYLKFYYFKLQITYLNQPIHHPHP